MCSEKNLVKDHKKTKKDFPKNKINLAVKINRNEIPTKQKFLMKILFFVNLCKRCLQQQLFQITTSKGYVCR